MHKRAYITLATALMLDAAGGIVFAIVEHLPAGLGLYWAVATATTTGYGDVAPHTTVGHVIAALVMMTVVPLFAAVFSLLAAGLTVVHVKAESERTQTRLNHIIRHHPAIPAFVDEAEDEAHT